MDNEKEKNEEVTSAPETPSEAPAATDTPTPDPAPAAPAGSERPVRSERPSGPRGPRSGDRGDRGDRGGDRGDRGGDRGGPRGGGRRRFFKKKFCLFCSQDSRDVDYKDPRFLRRFITERGKILPRRITGVCSYHQRKLSVAIKRSRHLALLSFKPE